MTGVRGEASTASYYVDTAKLRRVLGPGGTVSAAFVVCLCDYIDFLVKELDHARRKAA